MACGALMNQKQQPYFQLLDLPIPPSIRNLQVWIEAAWREGWNVFCFNNTFRNLTAYRKGFDEEGSKTLKKLINTSKWIGTAGSASNTSHRRTLTI